jgi:hypothetical protein
MKSRPNAKHGEVVRLSKRERKRQRLQGQVEALGFANYTAYLASPHWAEVRVRFRAFTPAHCIVCQKRDARLQIHHKTYKRLGRERLTDLVYVCHDCHRDIHFQRGTDLWKKTKRAVRWHRNLKLKPKPWPQSDRTIPTMSREKGPDGEWGPWEMVKSETGNRSITK